MMLKELIIGLVIVAGLSAAMSPEDYDALYPTEYPDQPAEYYQPPPDSAYFTNEEPADAGSLVDQGAVDDPSVLSSVPEGNGLWIVDGLTYEHTVSLNVPPKSWANQEIVPSVGGDLVIYYEYPTGQIVTQHLGRVRPYHRYWAWFYGPFPGVYKVWYVIDGVYRSNYVWYYVREDWPWWYGGYTFTTYYYTLPVRYYYRPIVYEPIRWTYKYTWEWRSTGHTWHDGWHDGHHDGRHDGRREFVTTIVDP
ncbi:MAG: hypothetical protein N3G75_05220 [Methanothrix sp.]|nr:hypothetical protein [Methanothrix sp.]MCX8207217.1 hypothetical protein [Methanothrix sp.]